MIIETNRLILRPWQDSDAPDLYEYAKDPRVGPIAGWPVHTSVENSLDIIHGVLSEPETYAVVLKQTGKAVGSVGIMFSNGGSAPMSETEAEIGYWIGVPYWGRGLIPEAVRALLRRSFEQLGRTAVWCGYYDGNEKSKRVQEKCGFVFHHTAENRPSPMGDIRTEHFTYLTKELWQKNVDSSEAHHAGKPTIRFATIDDTEKILFFIKELAKYEKMSDEVIATQELLREWIFEKQKAEVIFVAVDGQNVGFALFFHNFSTFLGRAGIYLEDLFVLPEYRGCGCGKALLGYLAKTAVERGCGRLEWCCLDWNKPSIDFYLSLGAKPLDDWTVYRLTGDTLRAVAENAVADR